MLGAVTDLIWVALGSALGGPPRYFLSGLIDHRLATTFLRGTIVVNISGAMMMGALAAAAAVKGRCPSPPHGNSRRSGSWAATRPSPRSACRR